MRCYICDSEATTFDKRDSTYYCDECREVVSDTFMEFEQTKDRNDYVSPVRGSIFKLKEFPWDEEDTPEVP